MMRHFNLHFKTRQLHLRDLVLRKVETTCKFIEKGKFGANLGGPFRIICIIKPGTFKLEDLDGKKLQRP